MNIKTFPGEPMDTPAAAPPATALEKIQIPEAVVFETIKDDIGPSIDKALAQAAKLSANITDESSRDLVVDAVEKLTHDCLKPLENWREEFYMQKWYRPGEDAREVFDSRLKPLKAAIKTMMGGVADYNIRKDRQDKLAQERADAEARRLREDADRKQREAEEAERKRKEAEETERRRIQEAKEAEDRRLQAEQAAKERREREAREAAAAETARRIREEEEARLRHAEVAQEVGNGAAKVDTILESATAIAPVLARPEQAKDLETLRLEQEQATRAAEERLLRERKEAEEAEKRRLAAETEAQAKREEATAAVAAATAAAAAAASTAIAVKSNDKTISVERWVWDLSSDGTVDGDRAAFIELLTAVLEAVKGSTPIPAGFDPLTFVGFDENHPENFRPAAITKAVSESKDRFRWPGIRAFSQRDERLKPRRAVGGRR